MSLIFHFFKTSLNLYVISIGFILNIIKCVDTIYFMVREINAICAIISSKYCNIIILY